MKVRLPNMTANSAGMVSFNSEAAETGIKLYQSVSWRRE